MTGHLHHTYSFLSLLLGLPRPNGLTVSVQLRSTSDWESDTQTLGSMLEKAGLRICFLWLPGFEQHASAASLWGGVSTGDRA